MSLSIPSTSISQQYLEPLLAGDRIQCRRVVEHALFSGTTAYELLKSLIWPTMEQLQGFYRDDQITRSTLNLATRLNRTITDQLAAQLPRKEVNNKKVLIFCGNDEPEELGGQISADLFESEGWTTRFAGGGVPEDEVLKLIGDFRPDLVVMFATLPSGVPAVRKLIDYLREVNSCPDMQVMCCGGIYQRAEGLADEIGADLYAPDAFHAVEVAAANPTRKATVDQQTVGRTRRSRKAAARKAAGATRTPVAPGATAAPIEPTEFCIDDTEEEDVEQE
ncbi:MAG: cobalamin-dependent protein [Tepidisphaeraceae bacterium]|jgi:methanogenic corrinoid protein MtbC1